MAAGLRYYGRNFAVWNDVKMSQTPSISLSQQRSAQKERVIRGTAEGFLHFFFSTLHTWKCCLPSQRGHIALKLGSNSSQWHCLIVMICLIFFSYVMLRKALSKGKLNYRVVFSLISLYGFYLPLYLCPIAIISLPLSVPLSILTSSLSSLSTVNQPHLVPMTICSADSPLCLLNVQSKLSKVVFLFLPLASPA